MKLHLSLVVILFLNVFLSFSQNETEILSLNEGTLDNQFEYVITKSNKYQDYKVVKTNWLYTLKEHTLDTLNALENELKSTQQIVNKQSKEIEDLKTNLKQVNANLDQTNKEKNSMSLFGIQMAKTLYNSIIWATIIGLLALLLMFIFKFKNSNTITKQAILTLAETEEEFEAHRKRALEREQKVMRRLQDELNKQKSNNQK